ncbi:hypothetical protein D9M69_650930 [compost metagenome]
MRDYSIRYKISRVFAAEIFVFGFGRSNQFYLLNERSIGWVEFSHPARDGDSLIVDNFRSLLDDIGVQGVHKFLLDAIELAVVVVFLGRGVSLQISNDVAIFELRAV